MELATLLGYVFATLFGLLFFVQYVRTTWYRHPWGRHVMAFTVVVELILILSLARRFFGDYPGREVLLTVMSWLFAAAMGQRALVQWRGSRVRRGRGTHDRLPDQSPVPLPVADSREEQ